MSTDDRTRREAQLCGQLYAIRSSGAEHLFAKRFDGVEDGFIKAIVCTDFLAHAAISKRIRLDREAEHVFEAYTNPAAVLKNQKRQMIGPNDRSYADRPT